MRDNSKYILLILMILVSENVINGGIQTTQIFTKNKIPACNVSEFTSLAHCIQEKSTLLCTQGLSGYSYKNFYKITHLKLLDWPGECLNINRLQRYFPELTHLELVNSSKLNQFKGYFHSTSKIVKLAIHGLPSLWEVPPSVISLMPNLIELDLRGNGLRHIKPGLLEDNQRLQRVHFSDNKWDCSDGGLDWLSMLDSNSTARDKIVDYDNLMCHQQLYKGKPLHKVMDIIRKIRTTCPEPCQCTMTHVVSDWSGAIIPLITVNCSNRQLVSPPDTLPDSTTTLRLENNKMDSIKAVLQNPQYQKLADLYLDNNSIPSVKELETSDWFNTFRVLSLRGNQIKQIPVFAFDKAFQSNNNIMHVYLGNNPWRCDCHYAPRFQALLRKYSRVIRDTADIRCSISDDKSISHVQISTMSLGNVCGKNNRENDISFSVINLVNILLVVLIIVVISRFIYDWHRFKTTGKLPWLSSVLP